MLGFVVHAYPRLFTRGNYQLALFLLMYVCSKTTCYFFDGSLDYIYILGLISTILGSTG